MERRFLQSHYDTFGIEERAGKPVIVGYASVFFDPNDAGTEFKLGPNMTERIMPTAFNRAVMEDDCRALFNHDPSMILGRVGAKTCRLSVDAKGLRYEIDPPDTQLGRDLVESIRRGDISGSSFGFRVRKSTWREIDQGQGKPKALIREIDDAQIYDVGPVTFPAYASSQTGIRSADASIVVDGLEEERRRFLGEIENLAVPEVRAKLLQLMSLDLNQ